jgi:hypothetical protein
MMRYRLMIGVRVFTLALGLNTVACVATDLETPVHHPANPQVASAPLSSTRVLSKGFDASSMGEKEAAPSTGHAEDAAPKPNADRWSCPMHPEIVRDAPGKCPICGMNLVKGSKQHHEHGVAH